MISEGERGTILTRLRGDESGTLGSALSEARSEEILHVPLPQCRGAGLAVGWGEKARLKKVFPRKTPVRLSDWLEFKTKKRRSQICTLLSRTEPTPGLALQ